MTLNEAVTIISAGIGFLGAIMGWSLWASWWLSKQFSQTRKMIWDKHEELQTAIEAKLEYHERHDDQRFTGIQRTIEERFKNVNDDLWDIRVRNAARDGLPPLVSREKPI